MCTACTLTANESRPAHGVADVQRPGWCGAVCARDGPDSNAGTSSIVASRTGPTGGIGGWTWRPPLFKVGRAAPTHKGDVPDRLPRRIGRAGSVVNDSSRLRLARMWQDNVPAPTMRVVGNRLAVKLASTHPAKYLGLGKKGSLEVGKDADIVVLDEHLNVSSVHVEGRQVT